MLCSKPIRLFTALFLLTTTPVFAGFSELECLQTQFETETSHGVKPFGFFKNLLKIQKNGCEIVVSHERFKFLKDTWNIDVCRGPVHIKKGGDAVEVIKKVGACTETASNYCKNLNELITAIQDDGLIFAPGLKEDLQTDHGKVYCTYILLDNYLNKGKIYSTTGKIIEPVVEQQVETKEEAPAENTTEGATQSW